MASKLAIPDTVELDGAGAGASDVVGGFVVSAWGDSVTRLCEKSSKMMVNPRGFHKNESN